MGIVKTLQEEKERLETEAEIARNSSLAAISMSILEVSPHELADIMKPGTISGNLS